MRYLACTHCARTFSTLAKHILSMRTVCTHCQCGMRYLACTHCPRTLCTLAKHILSMSTSCTHCQSSVRYLACTHCPRTFSTLAKHILSMRTACTHCQCGMRYLACIHCQMGEFAAVSLKCSFYSESASYSRKAPRLFLHFLMLGLARCISMPRRQVQQLIKQEVVLQLQRVTVTLAIHPALLFSFYL